MSEGLNISDDKAINECRICLENDSNENLLIPCHCSGTAAYVHRNCLSNWMVIRGTDLCNICNSTYSGILYKKKQKNVIHYLREEHGVWQYVFLGIAIYCFLSYVAYEGIVETRRKLTDQNLNLIFQTWLLTGYVIFSMAVVVTFFGFWFHLWNTYQRWKTNRFFIVITRLPQLKKVIVVK